MCHLLCDSYGLSVTACARCLVITIHGEWMGRDRGDTVLTDRHQLVEDSDTL